MSTLKTKLASAVVAVALVAGAVVPTTAGAQSVAELQSQIAALLAQINSLSGSTTTSTGSCSYVFTRDLSQGSTGVDVMNLQKVLNMSADTQVAVTGAGSKGMETSTFGPATAAAVVKFQNKYAAETLSPAGLTVGTGYVGVLTRSKLNAICSTPVVTTTTTTTTTGGQTTTTTSTLTGGAGDLEVVEKTSNTENEVTEGSTENVVSFEASADDNSDILVTSVRVVIDVNATSSASSRANRYIDEVLVTVDGKEVGSADISKFNRTGSKYTATINLDKTIVKAGKDARFYVALVARESISSDDRSGGTFDVEVTNVRYEDATGAIMSALISTGDIKSTGIEFASAADDNKLTVQSSSNTPPATILKVDEDTSSDEYRVFSFRLKTGSKSQDIEVTELAFTIATSSAAATTTVDSLINDIWFTIGSNSYDDYEIDGNKVVFTIDEGDLLIYGDDTETVDVYVKFNKQAGNYPNGSKVKLSLNNGDIKAEDQNGNSVNFGGSASGKDMTLNVSSASIGNFKWETGLTSNGGFIDFIFTVEADDEDFDVLASSIIATSTGSATTTEGTPLLEKITGTATAVGNDFTVASGDKATFRVNFDISGSTGNDVEIVVSSVAGQDVPDDKERSGKFVLPNN